MYAVVFDVNVLVSGLIVEGKPQELWLKAKAKEFTLIASHQIVTEFVKVISRKKFEKYVNEDDVRMFLEDLHQTAKFIRLRSKFEVVKEDPSDDTILRTAYDGKADYIASGDKHLLSLGEFRGIKIATVCEMLKLLQQ
jgi:putative PIN family toxin of toxin-antitoxin system